MAAIERHDLVQVPENLLHYLQAFRYGIPPLIEDAREASSRCGEGLDQTSDDRIFADNEHNRDLSCCALHCGSHRCGYCVDKINFFLFQFPCCSLGGSPSTF